MPARRARGSSAAARAVARRRRRGRQRRARAGAASAVQSARAGNQLTLAVGLRGALIVVAALLGIGRVDASGGLRGTRAGGGLLARGRRLFVAERERQVDV